MIGAGYIAVELAGVLHGLGTDTTLMVRREKPLRQFDDILSDALVEIFEKQNLKLLNHCVPQRLEKTDDGTITVYRNENKSVSGFDCVIWAVMSPRNLSNSLLDFLRLHEEFF